MRRPFSDPLDRKIIALAIPALGTLAVEPLYVATDTAIVGHLGTESLAGLAVASQVLVLVASLCNFLAYGTTQRLAHLRGAGKPRAVADAAVQAIWVGLGLGVLLAVVIGAGARPIASVFGTQAAALDEAVTYLRISAVSLPAVLLTIVCHGILRAEFRLKGLFVVVLAANLANLVLELVMVYGLDLGIAGSAWSTVAVQLASLVFYLSLVVPTCRPAAVRRPHIAEIRSLLGVGGALVARVAALMATFTIATAVAARIDEPTLGAHQIVTSCFFLLALCLDALAVPAQSLVAEALGGGHPQRAATIARRVERLSVRCGAVLGLALVAGAWWIPRAFSGDQAVVSRASGGLLVLAVLLIPGASAFAFDGILIGAGRFKVLSHMMIKVLLVFVCAVAIPLVVPGLGVAGIWGALAVWMAARALVARRWADQNLWVH